MRYIAYMQSLAYIKMIIVVLNILLPLILLGVLLLIINRYYSIRLTKFIGIFGLVLGILTIPLILFNYHYYNWVLEYFKIPTLLISLTLIPLIFINSNKIKIFIISLLGLAFIINLAFQILSHFAQMGGDWKPNNCCPNFAPPILTNQNYYLIKGAGYFIHYTKFDGLVYKEVSHNWDLDNDCKTEFKIYNSSQSVIYDVCTNKLLIEE